VWPAVRRVPKSAAGADRLRDLRCVLPPLDMPGCFGRRNSNLNLDDLRSDRPDLDCEPQQARGIPRNLQLDETVVPSQTDSNEAEGRRACDFERFMHAA
jgi:hypothetical protein